MDCVASFLAHILIHRVEKTEAFKSRLFNVFKSEILFYFILFTQNTRENHKDLTQSKNNTQPEKSTRRNNNKKSERKAPG